MEEEVTSGKITFCSHNLSVIAPSVTSLQSWIMSGRPLVALFLTSFLSLLSEC
jgi:hypothetical protein